MREQLIIFIGGAPTTGKSTIAAQLSEHLNLPWFSTDQIRTMLRATANKGEYPEIFNSAELSADEFLEKYSPEEIVDLEMKEANAIWKSIGALIKNPYPWEGFIIEGVHILPHYVHEYGEDKSKVVFLTDENQDRLREVVFKRGVFTDPELYSDQSKEKEIAWVTLFGAKLKAQAEQLGYPVVEVDKNETDLKKILKELGI